MPLPKSSIVFVDPVFRGACSEASICGDASITRLLVRSISKSPAPAPRLPALPPPAANTSPSAARSEMPGIVRSVGLYLEVAHDQARPWPTLTNVDHPPVGKTTW